LLKKNPHAKEELAGVLARMLGRRLSVAIVSQIVGKSPEHVAYSFVFDQARRLATRSMNIHIIRRALEKDDIVYDIHFHGINPTCMAHFAPFFMKHRRAMAFTRMPLHAKDLLLSFFLFLYGWQIAHVVKTNSIDLIHAHFAYPEGFAALLAKRESGKPLIITLHGSDILTEPSVGYGHRLNKQIDSLVREVLTEADAIIAVSSAVYAEALRAGVPRYKLYLIHNGVDINRFIPRSGVDFVRKKHNALGRSVVLATKYHEPVYGLEYLIRAIPIVLNKTREVVFIIGGEGSLRSYHEQLAKDLGVTKYVVFTGLIPRQLLPYYYAACDLFVVPSLQEGFGLVVSEAMACSKPVIATRVGGIPDQITDGIDGILVRPKDPEALAEAIVSLIDDPCLMGKMGLAARETVQRRFNIEDKIEKIAKIYKSHV
jgi:glycosyltransferase involved in cell wall biosynthesis